MNGKKKKININKRRYIIISSIILGACVAGGLYLYNQNEESKKHISSNKNDEALLDIVDIKEFTTGREVNGENLNKFVSHGKSLNNNFLYSKRDNSFNKLDLYKLNKNGDLIQNIKIENNESTQIELNSFIELVDESLILQTEEYSYDMETSIYSLRKYNKNGDLEFTKVLDNNSNILNLYSFVDMSGFISMESDSNGNMNIVKYDFDGEQIFKYKIKYDYASNIDVIFKEDNISFISKGDDCNIIELDKEGKEINKINIPYDNIIISKLFKTSDNGYIINFMEDDVNEDKDIKFYCIKLNSKGEEEWTYSESVNGFTKDIYETKDGYIVFNNNFYNKEKDSYSILDLHSITKIDKSGNKQWTKHIGLNDESNNLIFTVNSNYMEDGFLIITGILEDSDNNAHHIKLSIDKDGYISSVYNKDDKAVG